MFGSSKYPLLRCKHIKVICEGVYLATVYHTEDLTNHGSH